jgi:squalene-hopene/tetraprenyl-beta-curcumene cyclase
MQWPVAARDHQTFCVSCHTALPYALSRPVLRKVLAEQSPTPEERLLLENVTKRVRLGKEVGPYYSDQQHGANKTAESRGTEAVLNALILASHDSQTGKLSDDTRAAFEDMWASQVTSGDQKGAWSWLQFNLKPWEAASSDYYGAVLAAVAVGTAPHGYGSLPDSQDNLNRLREYLTRDYQNRPLVDRIGLLWASAKLPGLLDQKQQSAIIRSVLSAQQSDGGWCLSSLSRNWGPGGLRSYARSWIRVDGTFVDRKSDGFATGYALFALQQVGVPRDTPELQRGLTWLMENQNKTEGLWRTYSLNEKRDPSSNVGQFMSDAATAYAVLALAPRPGQH